MLLGFARGRVALQHLLDEVDAPAWAIELVTQQLVSGACGRAKTAMNTIAKNGISFGDLRIGKLVSGKMSLHKPCP